MSTAIVDGGRAGPDGAGGAYRNRVLTDRLVWWEALGAGQGIRYGASLSTVAGQMNLEVTGPWLVQVEERDINGTPNTGRGYVVWSPDNTVAAFDVAYASDRKDALVIAFADPSVGAGSFGDETSVVGGQVVVVTGVSGITTPRTDADIQAAVGSGGWVRIADVLVESTDTEINPANITESSTLDWYDTGWIDLGSPAASFNLPADSANNPSIRRIGNEVRFRGYLVLPSGGSFSASGNWLDLWTLDAAFRPPTPASGYCAIDFVGSSATVGPVVQLRVGTGGLTSVANIGTAGVSPGDQIGLTITYRVD